MKTRSKNKLQIKKIVEEQSDKEDQPVNIYPKKKEVKPSWSQQRLTLSYIPQNLIGRDKERDQIYDFVINCVTNKMNCKVLYISGVPGVGKTASTMLIMNKITKELQEKVDCFYINSLSLKNPKDIYKIIYFHLCPNGKKVQSCDKSSEDKGFYGNEIQKILKKTKINHILVVDEVDFLFTKDQKVFYNLFQWTSQITTKFSLIIIANIMDFPQRLSQKVSSRMGNNRLVFSPYSQPQIMQVVQDRLKGCTLFTQRAVIFASKKLAGFSSDIRTILEVLLKSVKNHKSEKKQGQIETEAIMKLWSEKFGILVQLEQDLAPLHLKIIQFVKQRGGECISKNLYQVLHQQYGMIQGNMLILLKQLEEMGMIKLRQANQDGCTYHRIKLAASLLL